ncbi:MAG: hypothetical protein OEY25_13600 [Candidatus Aminicenantes bacterium]|nr:hypothetical protein [Candidatus Aminicenantes bacterium]MDH5707350.1 hypothetical protein [Candidatus Aminicenantes bacterium]
MQEARCPFCFGENIKFIDFVRGNGIENSRPLMECTECEKFYWDDDGKEIKHLSGSCETILMDPEKCDEDVRKGHTNGKAHYDRRKIEEFDLLCGSCSHRKFFFRT